MFTGDLEKMMKDDTQPRHLDLVDMVKFIHKYSSRPEEWSPEIRDVLVLKVRFFTDIGTSGMEHLSSIYRLVSVQVKC